MPHLMKGLAAEWPAEAGWLVPAPSPQANCTALQYAIVIRAMKDVGILEVPLGSNRARGSTSISGAPRCPSR